MGYADLITTTKRGKFWNEIWRTKPRSTDTRFVRLRLPDRISDVRRRDACSDVIPKGRGDSPPA